MDIKAIIKLELIISYARNIAVLINFRSLIPPFVLKSHALRSYETIKGDVYAVNLIH